MKKRIRVFAFAVFMLGLPSVSFASPQPVDFSYHEGASGFFASVQYKYGAPYFGSLTLESGGKTLNLVSAVQEKKPPEAPAADEAAEPATPAPSSPEGFGSSTDDFQGRYSPAYLKDAGAFSITAGYTTGIMRFEAEAMRSRFQVNGSKWNPVENAYIFAAAKPSENISYPAQILEAQKYFVTLENRDVAITSLVANACYDMMPATSSIAPSACVGVGVSFAKLLGVLEQRLTYQFKGGSQYFVGKKTVIFLSGYVSTIGGRKITQVKVKHRLPTPQTASVGAEGSGAGAAATSSAPPAPIHLLYPDANLSLAYYGFELGVRLVF
uniref:Outer membrane protein-1x n=1 Tax=Anaplasma platys TaxID=949 RepID=F8QQF7_9RICK|nr:outer membrane protein-1x [Anaplasma platys]